MNVFPCDLTVKPYIIRAIHEYLIDHAKKPFLMVQKLAEVSGIPEHLFDEGIVVLNIEPQAISKLDLGNECIQFSARFRGIESLVYIPLDAILAIFADDQSQGVAFPPPSPQPLPPPPPIPDKIVELTKS
ncbi:MAG: ClpXP protease specificity-enhancing factor SspB, partial [Gammaproteobacteria bacterium]|nr:ClpXP protease specificity-enhancing factor SspB [Gammaproteobacteria bacterium]